MNFILGPTWLKERSNSHKLSSDLQMHNVAYTCLNAHMHTKLDIIIMTYPENFYVLPTIREQ